MRIPISDQASEFWKQFVFNGEYYFTDQKETCENPACHSPINYVFIIRHKETKDPVKLGAFCFQRWLKAIGLSVDLWFENYLKRLRKSRDLPPDQVLELQRRTKFKLVEKRKLKKFLFPIDRFRTYEEAEAWANSNSGYCLGIEKSILTHKELKCINGHRILVFPQKEIDGIVEVPEHLFKILAQRNCRICKESSLKTILGSREYWEIYLPKSFKIEGLKEDRSNEHL